MGKFNKGIFFGSIFGAGMTWLFTSKKGKETREHLLDHAAEIVALVQEEVKGSTQWKKLTKGEYTKMVEKKVDAYIKKNKLAKNAKGMLVKLVVTQWEKLRK